MGPHPAVAAVRLALRRAVADLAPGAPVLVACSGGADSLALVSAAVFEGRRDRLAVHGVTVDHGLQPGSAGRADRVVEQMRRLGVAEAASVRVQVAAAGGPEAAAREARYAALRARARAAGADVVLLGHTRDDQAETVLLGLARGSGARSLSGMAAEQGLYRRPLLGLARAETEAACRAEGLAYWSDPHNADPAFARVRVRERVLPVLERELGPGVGAALARTARLLRDDADALDAWADRLHAAAADGEGGLLVDVLRAEPAAVRRRVLRRAALAAGSPATELFSRHLEEVDRLVTDWHGQHGVDLPGPVRVRRTREPRGGTLRFTRGAVAG